MKLFVVLLFCVLSPFILAKSYYGPLTRCKCVEKDLCSYKFSSLIEPRNAKFTCNSKQVCCKPEHIIHNDNSLDDVDDSKDEIDVEETQIQSPLDSFTGPVRRCGKRTKISAYKRVTLPADFAGLGEFPWQAAILKNYSEGFLFVSSGVLVDRDIILTTAHSVDKLSAESILIRLGENNVQADPRKKYHHVNSRVSKILIKDDFNRDTLEDDLAVLCLDKKVRYNDIVSPICLPETGDLVNDDNRCVISGWGKNSYNGNYSTILRKAYLNLVPQDKCQYLIRKRISDPTFVLDPSFLCAGGEKGKDSCSGDAGGPLSCPNTAGQQVLAGIVSWGIGCGEEKVPGIYVNIRNPNLLNWIKNVAVKECRKVNLIKPALNGPNIKNPLTSNGLPVIDTISYNHRPPVVPNAIAEVYNQRPVDNYNNRPLSNDNYNNRPLPIDNLNRPHSNDNYNNKPLPIDNLNRPHSNDNYNNRPYDKYSNKPLDFDNYQRPSEYYRED